MEAAVEAKAATFERRDRMRQQEAAARMRIRYLSTWSALLGKEVQVQLFGESS